LSEPPFLSIRQLDVTYRSGRSGEVAALRGVDLELGVRRRLAVIGESGSGNSTLAHAVAGLLPASAKVTGEIARSPR
jgi:peptide/nickel transport system ATP-binding protein